MSGALLVAISTQHDSTQVETTTITIITDEAHRSIFVSVFRFFIIILFFPVYEILSGSRELSIVGK